MCTFSDPPTFAEPENETLEVPADEKMTLNCTATGNPVPTYRWRFSHSSQETNNIENVEKPVLMPSFQIQGTYSCTAANKQGSTTKYFTVIEVKGKKGLNYTHFCLCFTPIVCNFSCCYPPLGSHPGTTAGILMVLFFVVIVILGCVVYHKQRNSSAARLEGLNGWRESENVT